jgi:hypothetical protein
VHDTVEVELSGSKHDMLPRLLNLKKYIGAEDLEL